MAARLCKRAAVLDASSQLKDLPYKIEWFNFPAAQPLGEAVNTGTVDIGGLGDAPLVFALAAGARMRAVAATHSTPLGAARAADSRWCKFVFERRIAAQQRTAGTYESANVIRSHLDLCMNFDRSFPLP